MRRPDFTRLERALHDAGVAPTVVERTIRELGEHYTDIETDALASGCSPTAARRRARIALGRDADIVAAISVRRELLHWARRWPRSAHCVESVCYVALLPAMPFVYCAERGTAIARWGISTSLALLFTGTLLFCLQWFMSAGAPV